LLFGVRTGNTAKRQANAAGQRYASVHEAQILFRSSPSKPGASRSLFEILGHRQPAASIVFASPGFIIARKILDAFARLIPAYGANSVK
jgi:hypothetical protein